MTFAQPAWLFLLALLPLLMWYYRKSIPQRHVTLQVSRQNAMQGVKTWVVYARNWIQVSRWVALALLMTAMARPQKAWQEQTTTGEGMDIALAMDISPSMLSRDFVPDRLTVCKQLAVEFISHRPYDQVALIPFSGGAFTQCPLTDDRRILQAFIANLQVGRLEDGTAIGNGIATAVNRLRTGTAKSKIVIVLTDSENNAGEIGPVQAAEIAQALGIRVYTIGVGREGTVLSPSYQRDDGTFVFAARQMTYDSTTLRQVAALSGGRYFRAETVSDLEQVYATIDRLEKSTVELQTLQRTTDLFPIFLNIAFCILLIEMILRWGPLRVITV